MSHIRFIGWLIIVGITLARRQTSGRDNRIAIPVDRHRIDQVAEKLRVD
jgi:hypothetical protein